MANEERIIDELKRRIVEDYHSDDEEADAIAQGVCASMIDFIENLPKGISKTGWVARDHKDTGNFLVLYTGGKPKRNKEEGFWEGHCIYLLDDEPLFNDVKWKDKPVEAEITITRK